MDTVTGMNNFEYRFIREMDAVLDIKYFIRSDGLKTGQDSGCKTAYRLDLAENSFSLFQGSPNKWTPHGTCSESESVVHMQANSVM